MKGVQCLAVRDAFERGVWCPDYERITHEGQRRVLVDSCGGAVYNVVVLCSAAYADAMVV